MMDREVTIKTPVKRVIVNQWDAAEACIAVVGEDFTDMFVGVGSSGSLKEFQKIYGERYPKLQDLPVIGGGGKQGYDVEQMIALKPDLFIVNTSSRFSEKPLEAAKKLEEVGIPTLMLSMPKDPFSAPQEATKLLGKVFNKEERAEEISDFLDKQFALVSKKNLPDKAEKPTVYQEKGSGSKDEYDSTGIQDGWGSIIQYVGGDNIAVGHVGETSKIDPEYLITTDPNYIFVTGHLGYLTPAEAQESMDNTVGQYIQRTGWDKLSAVQNKDVYTFFHDHARNYFTFYPTQKIAKILYPEEFQDLDPDANLKEFYEKFMLLDYEDGVWFYKLGESLDE